VFTAAFGLALAAQRFQRAPLEADPRVHMLKLPTCDLPGSVRDFSHTEELFTAGYRVADNYLNALNTQPGNGRTPHTLDKR
jgi:hypothetical protein